jgi:hypothetical protein
MPNILLRILNRAMSVIARYPRANFSAEASRLCNETFILLTSPADRRHHLDNRARFDDRLILRAQATKANESAPPGGSDSKD